jgi:chromosome segregation ATPase
MRKRPSGFLALALLIVASASTAVAADDPAVARAKEMLRRTQEALRQAQSDNSDLQRAKTEAEQKLQTAAKELDAAKANKAAQASMNTKLTSAAAAQADLAHKLSDATDRLTAANTKLDETTKQLAARDAELGQVRQVLDQNKNANASCEAKNVTLYGYAEAVLDRYKKKGVWNSLSQKEPVFGLKEVQVENVVQEYQLKFDSQKVKP